MVNTFFFKVMFHSNLMNIFSKSAQFTSQALFGIFMLVLFVAILLYGYTALNNAQNEISDEELISLRQTIEQRTSICSKQSQRGRLETIPIRPNEITHVCYLSDSDGLNSNFVQMAKQRGLTQNHTIFLLNGPEEVNFYNIEEEAQDIVGQFQIYDIIPLEKGVSLSSMSNECQIRDSNQFNFRFVC